SEWMDRRPEIRGAEAEGVDLLASAVGTANVIGDTAGALAADPVDHRPDHRMIVDEADRRLRIAAGQESLVPAAMIGKVVRDRADDRELVGDASVHREMFADIDAGHIGADRAERAAVFLRGVWFHVIHFHVRRPARQPDEDDRGIRNATGLVGRELPRHDTGSAQATQRQGAELEEVASRLRAGTTGRRHRLTRTGGRVYTR